MSELLLIVSEKLICDPDRLIIPYQLDSEDKQISHSSKADILILQ